MTERSGNALTRAWRRLTAPDPADANGGGEPAVSDHRPGDIAVADCRDRQVVGLVGSVGALRADGPTGLEVELTDDSGALRLVFMGRRAIPGIVSGARLRVSGRVSCQRGGRVIYNPAYEIVGHAG